MFVKAMKSLIRIPKLSSSISYIHNSNSNSKSPSLYYPAIQFVLDDVQGSKFSETQFDSPFQNAEQENLPHKHQGDFAGIKVHHPWSEWVRLMERLLNDGYFDRVGNPFGSDRELGNKEVNVIRTISLNFARDQYQLIRYLSREHIIVIAGSGCPSTGSKVVSSGKRLRAHVGIEEKNVCSSCSLRGECNRAHVKAHEGEGGRTVDVMRLLLAYGLDPVIGSVKNPMCLNKRVEESVRTLMKQMSMIIVEGYDDERRKYATPATPKRSQDNDVRPLKQGDWICHKCSFNNFSRNIKCLRCGILSEEKLRTVATEQEKLPLKKGDWICDRCNFLNFARNTKCLQCKEVPRNRQLNPGEWECDSCNYLNFRRNMICLKCDHKRPIASCNADSISQPTNKNIRNRQCQTRLWFGQEKHGGFKDYDSLQGESFMHFPVAGGKSELSRESRCIASPNDDDCGGRDDDDDDHDGDMAEWFGRERSCKSNRDEVF